MRNYISVDQLQADVDTKRLNSAYPVSAGTGEHNPSAPVPAPIYLSPGPQPQTARKD